MKPIKVAIIGVGNCASSLVQGVAYYRKNNSAGGLIHPEIGGYTAGDVEFVMGVDVDSRKVGKDIAEAIFEGPNNTAIFEGDVPLTGAKVMMGRVSDGVADHMTQVGDKGFIVADAPEADRESIIAALKESGAEVLLNFLPVGSQDATEFYMECALEAGVGVVNCMPVFIASRPEWERRFAEKRLPIIGDDIKAQLGATITHRVLAKLFEQTGTSPADIDVVLASPATTDELCLPLATEGEVSCAIDGRAILNAERWAQGAEPFLEAGGTVFEYRRYLVNHEVGHLLGHGHEACPEPGAVAPVMLQQTLWLHGCVPNGWPVATS